LLTACAGFISNAGFYAGFYAGFMLRYAGF